MFLFFYINMSKLSASVTNTFNLLSIGQRGVGKTVFLAGSYAELHPAQSNKSQKLWFDCRDSQEEEKIERILKYVAQTGQYPPATMRITDFNFSLKRQNLWGTKTLCHFRWWDVPGESCNIHDAEFQKIVLSSHGCCVFINADALVNDRAYLKTLEQMIQQVSAIASLVSQHGLKYAFALIFTKCDLLKPDPINLLQIEEHLQPLLSRLDATKANYQRFYSAIPLVSVAGVPTLKATGAAAPLLWLIPKLRKLHNLQTRQNLGSGLMQGFTNSPSKTKSVFNPNLLIAIAGVGVLGVSAFVASLWLNLGSFKQSSVSDRQIRKYERILQSDPNNFDASINLANLRIQLGQPDQAIPVMEKLVQQKPGNIDLQLTLAQLYKLTDQKQKAEIAYDQVLAQQKNNLAALVNKAVLRSQQGDNQTAKKLLAQAEKAAPAKLKENIRAIAENTLPSNTEPISATK